MPLAAGLAGGSWAALKGGKAKNHVKRAKVDSNPIDLSAFICMIPDFETNHKKGSKRLRCGTTLNIL